MILVRSLLFNIVGYGTLAIGCVLNTIIGVFSQKAIIKIWNYGFIPFFAWSLRYIGGIAYRNEIICGCCGSVLEISDVIAEAEEDGIEEPIVKLPWIDIQSEIIGE